MSLAAGVPVENTSSVPPKFPKGNEEEETDLSFLESKIIRLLAVFLYLGGVSGLGFALAIYYILFFDSTMPEMYLKFPQTVQVDY